MPVISYSPHGPVQDVLNQIWALLEAKTKFTNDVKPANRKKLVEGLAFDDHDGGVETMPRLTITPTEFFRISGSGSEVKYDQAFEFDLVAEQPDVRIVNRLRATIAAVLEGAGQPLGLSYVAGWSMAARSDADRAPPAKPKIARTTRRQRRHIHLLRINVQLTIVPSDLAAWLG